MNEHVGFLRCPHCESPWDADAWACPYCHNVEPPAALKAAGPPWVWWLICSIALLAAAGDLASGGHVLQFLHQWSNSAN